MLVGAHLSKQQGSHVVREPGSGVWVACKADIFDIRLQKEGTLSII